MLQTKLSKIMTTNLVSVTPNTVMSEVEKIFKKYNFHHLPVVNKSGKVVGIVSKSDYLLLCDKMTIFEGELAKSENKRFLASVIVEEIMKRRVEKLRPNDTVAMAAAFFRQNRFHALPIVDEKNILRGMVTTFDLLKLAFGDSSEETSFNFDDHFSRSDDDYFFEENE